MSTKFPSDYLDGCYNVSTILLLICALFILTMPAGAEDKDSGAPHLPRLGSAPAALSLELLQAPADTKLDWNLLRGKVVLLEFWATWCGPCVAAIPHLNELSEKLKGADIQFISISGESKEVIETFLKRRPLNTWIGLDKGNAVFNKYGIKAIPTTIIIDKQGKVAAVVSPGDLDENDLRDLIAGKPTPRILRLSSENQQLRDYISLAKVLPPSPAQAKALYQVEIVPQAIPTSMSRRSNGANLELHGATVNDLLAEAYATPKDRVIVNTRLSDGRFDAFLKMPDSADKEQLDQAFQLALRQAFNILPHWESRLLDIYRLDCSRQPAQSALRPSVSNGGSLNKLDSNNKLESINMTMDELARLLEDHFGKPVLNETKLSGGYDLNLPLNRGSLDDLSAGLETLGLRLKTTRSQIKVLVVEPAKPSLQ